jgi:hypothetical protein
MWPTEEAAYNAMRESRYLYSTPESPRCLARFDTLPHAQLRPKCDGRRLPTQGRNYEGNGASSLVTRRQGAWSRTGCLERLARNCALLLELPMTRALQTRRPPSKQYSYVADPFRHARDLPVSPRERFIFSRIIPPKESIKRVVGIRRHG